MMIRLLACDLDGTLLGGDPGSTQRFADAWNASEAPRPRLVYLSGRLDADLRATSSNAGLPRPDAWVGGVGTTIRYADGGMDLGYTSRLGQGWHRESLRRAMRHLGVRSQASYFQSPWKLSYYSSRPDAQRWIGRALQPKRLSCRIVHSSRQHLDLIPHLAGKAAALRWLANRWGIPHSQILVCGDSENDLDMLSVPGVQACIPLNATPGLKRALFGRGITPTPHRFADAVIAMWKMKISKDF